MHLAEQGSVKQIMSWGKSEKKVSATYNDVNGLIHIDDNAVFIDDRDSRDTTFREHVYDVENTGIQSCRCDRIEGIFM